MFSALSELPSALACFFDRKSVIPALRDKETLPKVRDKETTLTVLCVTSPANNHPSTTIIEQVLASTGPILDSFDKVLVLIVFDGYKIDRKVAFEASTQQDGTPKNAAPKEIGDGKLDGNVVTAICDKEGHKDSKQDSRQDYKRKDDKDKPDKDTKTKRGIVSEGLATRYGEYKKALTGGVVGGTVGIRSCIVNQGSSQGFGGSSGGISGGISGGGLSGGLSAQSSGGGGVGHSRGESHLVSPLFTKRDEIAKLKPKLEFCSEERERFFRGLCNPANSGGNSGAGGADVGGETVRATVRETNAAEKMNNVRFAFLDLEMHHGFALAVRAGLQAGKDYWTQQAEQEKKEHEPSFLEFFSIGGLSLLSEFFSIGGVCVPEKKSEKKHEEKQKEKQSEQSEHKESESKDKKQKDDKKEQEEEENPNHLALILQHDRAFIEKQTKQFVDSGLLKDVVETMKATEHIRYVGFRSNTTKGDGKVDEMGEKVNLISISSSSSLSQNPTNQTNSTPRLDPLTFWYDSNHLAIVDRYLKIYNIWEQLPYEFKHLHLELRLRPGDFLEDRFGQAQHKELKRLRKEIVDLETDAGNRELHTQDSRVQRELKRSVIYLKGRRERLIKWFGCYVYVSGSGGGTDGGSKGDGGKAEGGKGVAAEEAGKNTEGACSSKDVNGGKGPVEGGESDDSPTTKKALLRDYMVQHVRPGPRRRKNSLEVAFKEVSSLIKEKGVEALAGG